MPCKASGIAIANIGVDLQLFLGEQFLFMREDFQVFDAQFTVANLSGFESLVQSGRTTWNGHEQLEHVF
jgi:hypothetical protein